MLHTCTDMHVKCNLTGWYAAAFGNSAFMTEAKQKKIHWFPLLYVANVSKCDSVRKKDVFLRIIVTRQSAELS